MLTLGRPGHRMIQFNLNKLFIHKIYKFVLRPERTLGHQLVVVLVGVVDTPDTTLD